MNRLIFSQNSGIQGATSACTDLESLDSQSTIGDYVVFVDESGDANLDPIDPRFPMLNLVFCLIRKDHYIDFVVPRLHQLKIDFFGHADLVLHESEMRRKTGAFAILADGDVYSHWMQELLAWIEQT